MLKLFTGISIIISLVSLSSVGLGYSIPENGTIFVPNSTNIPNIDGQWSTPDEWTDASENIIQNEFEWTAYIGAKHNQTHIFVLLDFVTDQSSSDPDVCGIAFDTENDGGNFPDLDDYLFTFDWGALSTMFFFNKNLYQGTGRGGSYSEAWVEIDIPLETMIERGFSSTHDPYEDSRNHRIYELQIPCSFLDIEYSCGFYAFVYDNEYYSKTLLEWPEGAGGIGNDESRAVIPAPGTWGNIESDVKFIPEFSSLVIILLVAVVILPTIIVLRKRLHLR